MIEYVASVQVSPTERERGRLSSNQARALG